MDIKELDKKQLILLTLLITFVVSIATGIITVSLMNQMPKSVPQTINNVIQRTIEKVTTVQVPTPVSSDKVVDKVVDSTKDNPSILFNNDDALVNIYSNNTDISTLIDSVTNTNDINNKSSSEVDSPTFPDIRPLGQGIIISEIGLILVDSSFLSNDTSYKVILNKMKFNASVLKKFNNGFTILKISVVTDEKEETSDTTNKIQ